MKKEGWRIKKLGEVCDVRDGTHDSPKYQNEGFPLITSKNLVSGEINFENVNLISEDDFEKINKRSKVDIGDILMPMIGTIGNPVIVKTSKIFAIKNVALIKFKPSSEVLNRFILSLLKSNLYSEKLLSLNKGGTQKFIALGTIRNFLIPVPPLPIQEQIVAELDTLSDIIAKKREQLTQLDTLAQASFYDMFGDPVENEKGWDVKRLEDVCNKITDGEHFRPETITNGIPFLSAKDVLQDRVSFDDCLYVSEETAEKALKRCNPSKDDILIVSRGATVGRMNVIKTNRVFCLLGSVILLKLKRDNLSPYFILYALRNPDVLNKMRGLSSASAQQALYLKDLKSLSVPLPPLPLQNQFAERIGAIEKQKELIEKSITETQTLFDYTMDKYFN